MYMRGYWAYLKEREGVDVVERPYGFMLLKPDVGALYVQDIFVYPEFRKQGKAQEMLVLAEDMAAKSGFVALRGSCDPTTNGATESMRMALNYGFKLETVHNGLIYYKKELVNG
jgi:GNAT superfamily N-acetyltransferase